jgi:hypothetical protein
MTKVYRIVVCLLFFTISFITSFYLSKNLTSSDSNVNLVIEIKTQTDDAYQVFYDTGKGFNETETVPYLVSGSSEFQRIEFPLPASNINSIRLDFGSNITQIQMKEIYLQTKKNQLIITPEFDSKHDIGKFIVNNGITEITTTGNDPFINTKDISALYQGVKKETNTYLISLIISIFLTMVLVCFLQVNTKQVAKFTSGITKNARLGLIVAIFILLLYIPFFSNIIPRNQVLSNVENRMLTPKPEFNIHSLDTFPKEFEKYFNDNFKFRDQFLKFNNYAKVKILNLSPNPLVVIGKNDWLFYTGDKAPESMEDYQGLVRFTDDELKMIKNNLEQRKKWLSKKGITYLFCIAPNKQTIYPEYLPSNMKKLNSETRTDQLINYLNQYSDVEIIDLRKVLLENKTVDNMLYYKTDTHWNEYGAYIGYQEIMRKISDFYPNLEPLAFSNFMINSSVGSGGDIANMLAMKSQYKDNYIHLVPKVKTVANDLKVDKSIYPNPDQLVTKQTDISNLPNLLMFRDSFSTSLVPFLSEHFNKSIYIWDHKFNAKIIEQDKPNIVIEETVERLLPTLLVPNPEEIR